MKRYVVCSQDKSWLVVDTLSDKIVKIYSSESTAREVAECKNLDEELEIFHEFGWKFDNKSRQWYNIVLDS